MDDPLDKKDCEDERKEAEIFPTQDEIIQHLFKLTQHRCDKRFNIKS